MLALIQQWKRQDDHQHQSYWWTNPRQITAQAGTFDAPADSSNDDMAAAAQMLGIWLLLCAIYRANPRTPSAFSCKSGYSAETVESRAITGFSAFFWLFSCVPNELPPHIDSGRYCPHSSS